MTATTKSLIETSSTSIIDCAPYEVDLIDLCSRITAHPHTEVDEFLLECAIISGYLPEELRGSLVDFRLRSNRDGILLLRNLPQDAILPETPSTSKPTVEKLSYRSEQLVGILGSVLGDAVSYAQEKHGALFQQIHPIRTDQKQQTSGSSAVHLMFHTETAFHPERPDYLALYCLRADHEGVAETIYTSVGNLLPVLDDSTVETLMTPSFRTGVDFSFGGTPGEDPMGVDLPVLSGNRSDLTMVYDEDLMRGTVDEASYALALLREAVYSTMKGVRLRPGDLLFLDNQRTVHGRTAFAARYDGNDRWLQRTFFVRDLQRTSAVRIPGTRVIARTF